MKRFLVSLMAVLMLISLAACGGPGTNNAGEVTANEVNVCVVSPQYPKAIAFNDKEELDKNREENPISATSADAVSDFAYRTASPILSSIKVNGCYSPISLYYALALAGTGANGQTKDEFADLLGITDTAQLSQDMSNLYRLLYSNNKTTKSKIANSLWLDKDYQGTPVEYKDSFKQNAASMFYASLFTVDFASPDAGTAMADWISEQTNGTLSPEIRPDPEQIMSIINTVYFKDEWVDPFDPVETHSGEFLTAEGPAVTCYYMNMECDSRTFVRGDGFTRSALSFKSGAQMVFVLPDPGVSPESLVSNPEDLRKILEEGQSSSGEVCWSIPKFCFDSEYDLKDMLKALGLKAAFTSDADFTGIADQPAFLSQITQQTNIAISEYGVVASSFTEIETLGAMISDGAYMILNRPFIYAIYSAPVSATDGSSSGEAAQGCLLFVGICGNPAV